MKIGITLKQNAYTPEAFAYKRYLESHGHFIDLSLPDDLDKQNDVNIYFMGIRPFWKTQNSNSIEIHEYQSLSIPPLSFYKDLMKRKINTKPNGRIFLNSFVSNYMKFSDNVPYIYRDMGVEVELFQKSSVKPLFDIVYSGSIKGRTGLVENLIELSKKFKILLIGEVEDELKYIFDKNKITMTGKVQRRDLPELYSSARYGLNYTPDIFPFNYQTSTKTLEYLASGLQVISNRYHWIETFSKSINYKPIWIEDLFTKDESDLNNLPLPNMDAFKWENILDECNFNSFIIDIVK